MITLTRLGEPDVQYTVSPDAHGLPDPVDLAHQLSSLPSSYMLYNSDSLGLALTHHKSYPNRLISAKESIQELRNEIEFLKDAERQRQIIEKERWTISNNWEIYSRIAQGINDEYTGIVPQQPYSRLKAAGHGYLPILLTAWAINQNNISKSLEEEIDDGQYDQYSMKIGSLYRRDLINDVTAIWDAIPLTARNLMITMWIKRDLCCSDLAHPTPSVSEALNLIQLDHGLTQAEISLVAEIIPIAHNKKGDRLFSSDEAAVANFC